MPACLPEQFMVIDGLVAAGPDQVVRGLLVDRPVRRGLQVVLAQPGPAEDAVVRPRRGTARRSGTRRPGRAGRGADRGRPGPCRPPAAACWSCGDTSARTPRPAQRIRRPSGAVTATRPWWTLSIVPLRTTSTRIGSIANGSSAAASRAAAVEVAGGARRRCRSRLRRLPPPDFCTAIHVRCGFRSKRSVGSGRCQSRGRTCRPTSGSTSISWPRRWRAGRPRRGRRRAGRGSSRCCA